MRNNFRLFVVIILSLMLTFLKASSNILMVTMGGTKSHKIPFMELANGLLLRGHQVTFIHAFPDYASYVSLSKKGNYSDLTPDSLVTFVRSFTDWDLLGSRMKGQDPVPPLKAFEYAFKACDTLLGSIELQTYLQSQPQIDLLILDGAYPECALGLVYHFRKPFMYLNTVGSYTGSLSISGNPTLYSITPFFARGLTDNMTLMERSINSGYHVLATLMHSFLVNVFLQRILRQHFGRSIPHIYELSKNVSFILQNTHFSVSYPRPYLPNVAEIACIHCKTSKEPLSKDINDFIKAGNNSGFIYVSMGSSVKASNMPRPLRNLLITVFSRLPYQILWKWESNFTDLPSNVKVSKWLPQQKLLAHPQIKAFITHGGLLSMYETVYHAVPIIILPVFCDHDANAAKAALDGYGLKLDLLSLTVNSLFEAVIKVVTTPIYKINIKFKQSLLKDQISSPMKRAVFWTEYVIRHNGAQHLQSPARHLTIFQYYIVDVIFMYISAICCVFLLTLYVKKVLLILLRVNITIYRESDKNSAKIKIN